MGSTRLGAWQNAEGGVGSRGLGDMKAGLWEACWGQRPPGVPGNSRGLPTDPVGTLIVEKLELEEPPGGVSDTC